MSKEHKYEIWNVSIPAALHFQVTVEEGANEEEIMNEALRKIQYNVDFGLSARYPVEIRVDSPYKYDNAHIGELHINDGSELPVEMQIISVHEKENIADEQ